MELALFIISSILRCFYNNNSEQHTVASLQNKLHNNRNITLLNFPVEMKVYFGSR